MLSLNYLRSSIVVVKNSTDSLITVFSFYLAVFRFPTLLLVFCNFVMMCLEVDAACLGLIELPESEDSY